jgi:hypothetical protein
MNDPLDTIGNDLAKIGSDPIVKALIPVEGMLLNVICPAVPAVVWVALITALLSGDLTPEHIQKFMQEHNITIYSDPKDFPIEVHAKV